MHINRILLVNPFRWTTIDIYSDVPKINKKIEPLSHLFVLVTKTRAYRTWSRYEQGIVVPGLWLKNIHSTPAFSDLSNMPVIDEIL